MEKQNQPMAEIAVESGISDSVQEPVAGVAAIPSESEDSGSSVEEFLLEKAREGDSYSAFRYAMLCRSRKRRFCGSRR